MTPVDPRRLCQIEIPVQDVPRALAFYAQAFGWQRVPAELHEYVILEVPPACPFGISLVPGRADRAHMGAVLYFAVDDPETVAQRVEQHGGKRRFGPVPLSGYGEIHQIEDSEGNRFGLYRARDGGP